MQPVATQAPQQRELEELVRLIASDALNPTSVTADEERRLLRSFKDREKKLLCRMDAEIAGGAPRRAWRTGEQLRRSMAGRYLALWRSKPRDVGNPRCDTARAARVREILARLSQVGQFDEPAHATVFVKRKDRMKAHRQVDRPMHPVGGPASRETRRVIFSFGWVDKARQRLVATSLTPFANYHPSQFMLGRGGRSGVCEYLVGAVPNLPADHVFVQVDVRDFFGSISTAWIERRFRLPEAMIRGHMHSGEMRLFVNGRARAYLRGGENDERVRRVLPQGSALSSLVAEMAMAEVLRGLTDHLSCALVVVYSDNLGIFMPAAAVATIEDYLRRAFGTSSVGPFELAFSTPAPVTRGFRFLGHEWRVEGGTLRTYVPEQVAEARAMVLLEQMMGCFTRTGLWTVRARIMGQAHEWSLWHGVGQWQGELLARWADAWEALEADERATRIAA